MYIVEFRYLGHVITAYCRDDKDIERQFKRKKAVGNMLVNKFSVAPMEENCNCSSHIVTQFMDVSFASLIHTRTLLESLLSVIVTHSSVLLMSPDTPARV